MNHGKHCAHIVYLYDYIEGVSFWLGVEYDVGLIPGWEVFHIDTLLILVLC